jgi:tetratricopeptide (TPR) repeat protein
MKPLMRLLWIMIFSGRALFAQETDPKILFETATKLYEEKAYGEASVLWQQIADQELVSADLYYNLGNAYFKAGNLAKSILYYEKAAKLEPDNEDIQFNLKLANLRVSDRIEAKPRLFLVQSVENFFNGRSSNTWAMITLYFAWILVIPAAIYWYVPSVPAKKISFFSFFIFFFLLSFLAGIAWRQYRYESVERFAIVMVTNTYIKSEPDPNSVDLFILREGVKVETRNQKDDYTPRHKG